MGQVGRLRLEVPLLTQSPDYPLFCKRKGLNPGKFVEWLATHSWDAGDGVKGRRVLPGDEFGSVTPASFSSACFQRACYISMSRTYMRKIWEVFRK